MRIISIVSRPASAPLPNQEQIERIGALFSELGKDGSVVDAGGTWPGLLEMRITRRAADYSVVDGPLGKAEDVVGGYLLLEVPDREAAVALTHRILDATGDGTHDLHEIAESPPDPLDCR